MLCEQCAQNELQWYVSSCFHCGKLTKDFATCPACKKRERPKHVMVGVQYSGVAKELVSASKYDSRRGGLYRIAEILSSKIPETKFSIITHLPTTSDRIRSRGFDQSQVLAKEIAATRKLPYAPLLHRLHGDHQVGGTRSQRLERASSAYKAINISSIRGARVLLIDDVMTTGASVTSATKVLVDAGAKTVDVAVFAR
jgi:ComF family protein